MQKKTMCGTILAAGTALYAWAHQASVVAQGAAMMECGGLVTEKVAGWRFEASE